MSGHRQLSVGLVGYGRWGQTLAKNMLAHAALSLDAICHCSAESKPGFFRSLDDLIASGGIDAVVVATPLRGRSDVIERALTAGIHVLTEKPLAEHASRAEKLAQLAQDRSLTLFTDFVHSYARGIEYARTRINELGDIHAIEVRLHQPGPVYRSETIMNLLGCHALAMINRVVAEDGASIDWSWTRYEEFGGGLGAVLEGSLGRTETRLRVSVHVGHPVRSRTLDLIGERGSISVSLAGDSGVSVGAYPSDENGDNLQMSVERIDFDETGNLMRVIDRFVASVEEGAPDNRIMALAVQQVLDACNLGAF